MKGWREKKILHHWRKMHIKNWQILLLLLFWIGASIFFLRQNNLKMIELREAVVVADTKNGDVASALEGLNGHVFNHMNTKIVRPVELVNTYNRQAQRAIEAANKTNGKDIYAEATAACERRGVPLTSIAQCAADYAITNNPGVGPKQINLPDKNLFIYSFATPKWTPDLAGFSLLISTLLLIWLIARCGEYIAVKIVLKRRLNNNF